MSDAEDRGGDAGAPDAEKERAVNDPLTRSDVDAPREEFAEGESGVEEKASEGNE